MAHHQQKYSQSNASIVQVSNNKVLILLQIPFLFLYW